MKILMTKGKGTGIAAIVLATALVSTPGSIASGFSEEMRLNALETGVAELSGTLDSLTADLSGLSLPGMAVQTETAPVIRVAQSRDIATLQVRLGELEEQMRVLNGQIEGLQFQMTQLQAFLERMQEDNEFRFQQLEGNSLGNNDAADQFGGDVPTEGSPQFLEGPQEETAMGDGFEDESLDDDGAFDLDAGVEELGTLSQEELEDGLGAGQPLDLTFDAGTTVTDDDANAQYRAGYDAAMTGDFAFAEEQFRQFIALFPDHPQAPEATAWLGESLIQRSAFDEAANVLLNGFESYPNSALAPELLLKLGVALDGAGERDTACRTYSEVLRRYPDMSGNMQNEVIQQMAVSQC